MISTFGNNIVSAFTGGVSVKAIYTYGEKVWPVPGPSGYYIQWEPSDLSAGRFKVSGILYNYSDYSGFFSVSRYLESVDFGRITSFYTNAEFLRVNEGAFDACPLTYVCIPLCEYIGTSAFQSCSSLISIDSNWFRQCLSIGRDAFAYCGSLSFAYFYCCESVGYAAFNYCPNLRTVVLPMCTYIDDLAFRNGGIRSLYLNGNGGSYVCQIALDAFGAVTGGSYYSYFSIYVPSSLYSKYRTAYSSTGSYSEASWYYSHIASGSYINP
jgi:hypothetical protein